MATKKEKSGEKELEAALKEIRKKFGEESIGTLKDKPVADVESYSTGSIGLDAAIGVGGLPRGRIVEIYGPESSGKTTLAMHVIAQAQKAGGVCAFVDVEHSFVPDYERNLGVDTDTMLFSQPNGGEEALQITESLVRSGKVQVVVVDSVAAIVPKAELDGEIGAQHVGAQARLMSQSMRILTASIGRTNTLVIFINQIRTNIGAMGYGTPETTAGGRALKFYSSVRLDIRRIARIKKGEDIVGGRIRVKVAKNKVAAPFRQTEFDLLYNEGISHEGELIALGEKYGVVKKSGMAYSYGEEKIGSRGYDSARTFLKENPKIAKKIEKDIRANL